MFDPATANYFKPQGAAGSGVLPGFMGDVPCFTDVDGDGYVDLLLGTDDYTEPGQALRYFRNQGPGVALENAFVVVNNDLGQIRDGAGARPYHLSPTVADFDGDGRPDLVTADNTGAVRFFSNYRTLLAGPAAPRTNLFWNALLSQYEGNRLGQSALVRYGLAAADVNADGVPELFIGTENRGPQQLRRAPRHAHAHPPPGGRHHPGPGPLPQPRPHPGHRRNRPAHPRVGARRHRPPRPGP